MNQEGPSKRNKRTCKKTYAAPGILSSLAKRKRNSVTTKETIKAIRSEKERLIKLIEQQPAAPEAESNEQTVEEQPVEEHPVEEHHIEQHHVEPVVQPEEQVEDVMLKKTRGRTQMHKVHARDERKVIVLNKDNQPVGPTDQVVTELSSFLGTLARNATLCRYDIFDWRKMESTNDIWDYIKTKYDIPDGAKGWALERVRDAWRNYRKTLKKVYYDPYKDDEVRMANRPDNIPECQFKALLIYWDSEKFKKMSKTNVENRKKLMTPHTTGKKSFALIRQKLEKEKETVSRKDMFMATRVRKSGRSYKLSDEITTTKIAEMAEVETQASADGQSVDAFAAVMGPEHPGRLRLYGGGVTKTSLNKSASDSTSSSSKTNDVVQEMQKMEEKMEEKMKEQMEEQKKTIRQEIMTDIIAQLQLAGLVNPNILATLTVPSNESTTQAASAAIGRNNQGVEIEEGDESDEDMP